MEENWDDDEQITQPKFNAPLQNKATPNYEEDFKGPENGQNSGRYVKENRQVSSDRFGNKDEYSDSRQYGRNQQNYQKSDDRGYSRGGRGRFDEGRFNSGRGGFSRNFNRNYEESGNDQSQETPRWGEGESRGRGGFRGRGQERNFNNSERSNRNFNNTESYSERRGPVEEGEKGDVEILSQRPPVYIPEMPSEDPNVIFQSHITEGIDFNKYNDIVVKVSGGNEKQEFISSFDECDLFDQINKNIKRSNYRIPTPIQKFTIPIILNDSYDIMGCAQTGSGKTAAYLIPTFSNILKNQIIDPSNRVAEPSILVLSPTRELAQQICLEMRKFSFGTEIKTAMVYGGIAQKFISDMIRNGCDSIAATPGRLLDLVNRGWISLQKVKYLIMDEADRMLDMGFINDIRKIVFNCGMPGPRDRRCFMFSATFPQEVRELAREILAPDYYFITVGMVGSAAQSISQEFYLIAPFEKRNKLMDILEENRGSRILVFVESKRSADFLTTFICQKGLKATSIHGDRFQEQREEALKMFRSGETTILVATSVAARGLDIKDVQIVVNFDLPSDIDEYVHRIGRTGRLGNKGLSISFFTADKDDKISSQLVETLRNAGQQVPDFLENFDYAPVKLSNRNERDDRKISSRTHHVNPTNSSRREENKSGAPYVEAVEEQWD